MFSQVSVCPQGMGGYLDPMSFLGVGVSGARFLLGWVCLGRWVPTPQTWNLRGWSHVLWGEGLGISGTRSLLGGCVCPGGWVPTLQTCDLRGWSHVLSVFWGLVSLISGLF